MAELKLAELTVYVVDAFRANWVFVKVASDSGLHGWGEATLEFREPAVAEAVHALEPGLAAADLGNINDWWQRAYRDAYWRGGPVLTSALSGVEMALWDLKGKTLGVPVRELLGGAVRHEVPCYANAWFTGARTPSEFAAAAVDAVAGGYSALKWDPFGSASRTMTRGELRRSLEVIDAVRSAVGDDVELMIEGHGRFDMVTARRVGGELDRFGVLWFEEPLIPGNVAQYVQLRNSIATPVALGERLYTRWDFRECLDRGGADVVQPDVSHVGGISELLRVGSMAETWHAWCCPHNPCGPVAHAATAQLAAVLPNCPYLETMATDVPWRQELAVESARLVDGRMRLDDTPGLGVDINEDLLTHYPYQAYQLRHYDGTLTDIRPDEATTTFAGTED